MRTVRLYGHLAQRFGRVHQMDVRSPIEAVRALCATRDGFRAHLLTHSRPGYRVLVGRAARRIDDLALPADDDIRIVPVTAGAGRGIGSVILGAALVGLAVVTGGTSVIGMGMGTAWAAGGATFGAWLAGNIGMSLILGGVAQMLAPQPKTPGAPDRPDSRPSYVFDGAVNTAAQGNPVPVCYGRLIVGSQVISAGMAAEEYTA